MVARQYSAENGDKDASAGTVVVYVVYRDGLGAIFDSAYVTPAAQLRRRPQHHRVADRERSGRLLGSLLEVPSFLERATEEADAPLAIRPLEPGAVALALRIECR